MKKLLSVFLSGIILAVSLFSPFSALAKTKKNTNEDKGQMFYVFQSLRESRNLDNYSWEYNNKKAYSSKKAKKLSPIGKSIITPKWNVNDSDYDSICGVHGYIIQDANDFAEVIPNKYMNLVKTACKWCDTKWYISNNPNNKVEAVHDCGNYLANIKYLWKLAPKVYHSNDTSLTNTEINTFCDQAFNSLSSAAKSRAATIELNSRVRKILKDNKAVPSGTTNQTQGGRCKYIVFGMLLHLIGDLYAHRLIVPKSALNHINGGTFNSHKTYNKSDVNSNRKQAFINDINNKKVTFTNAHKKSSNPNEYNYLKSSVTKNKYEDNPSFWPGRLDEATTTAYTFLDSYSDGFWAYFAEPCEFNDGLESYNTYLSEVL